MKSQVQQEEHEAMGLKFGTLVVTKDMTLRQIVKACGCPLTTVHRIIHKYCPQPVYSQCCTVLRAHSRNPHHYWQRGKAAGLTVSGKAPNR